MRLIFEWAGMMDGNLRIDTHADNATMLRRIDEAGFTYCGVVRMDDGSPRRAYQRVMPERMSADDILAMLEQGRNEEQRRILGRFFKTGPGEYGEGDAFIGLKVPQTRAVVRSVRDEVGFAAIAGLMESSWHEARLCGLLLLVEKMKALRPGRGVTAEATAFGRKMIVDFYLHYAERANNWDLVDLSAPYILGEWLSTPLYDECIMPSDDVLERLAVDRNLWRQRIAIVSTLALIRKGMFGPTLRLSRRYLTHRHDLIHKATGWMLREVGKRDMETLREFLREYYLQMPRTALRYAIEKMDADERRRWMTR